MPFTATPGTPDSEPGNLVPGFGADVTSNPTPFPPGAFTAIPGIGYAMAGNFLPGMGATRGQWKNSIAESVAGVTDVPTHTGTYRRSIVETVPVASDSVIASTPTNQNSLYSLPYYAKVYTNNLVFKKTIGEFLTKPALHCSINSGWDQIKLSLKENDVSVDAPSPGDIIELYEQGGDGELFYRGIIEDVPDVFDPSNVAHELLVSGMVAELGDTLYNKDWTGLNADVATIVADIVSNTKHLTTNSTTVPLTGKTGNYNFQQVSAVDALTECVKMAGPNFYWFADHSLVWFISVNFGLTPTYTLAQGVDYTTRNYQAPISNLKNYIVANGGVPSGQTVNIQAVYDGSVGSPYGKKSLIPPISYPDLLDLPTLQNMVDTVGAQLNRRLRSVSLTVPVYGKRFSLADKFGATLQYFEPVNGPFVESFTGSGQYTQTLVITDIKYDGPHQTVTVSDMPVSMSDFQYMLDQMAARVSNASVTSVSTTSTGTIPPGALSPVKPSLVTGLVGSTGTDRISQANNAYIVLNWDQSPAIDYVSSYAISYFEQGAADLTPTTVISVANSYKITGLTPGKTYVCTVYAINANAVRSDAAPLVLIQAAVKTAIPGAPTDVQCTPTPRGAGIFWTPPVGEGDVQGYELQVSISGGPYNPIDSGIVHSPSYNYIAATGTFPGTGVLFQVRTVDWSGNRSDWSLPSGTNSDGVYFDELQAGQIEAAGTITGGAIQTAKAGRRAVMDSAGLRLYDGSATDYGDGPGITTDLNSSTGNAFFAGTVSASKILSPPGVSPSAEMDLTGIPVLTFRDTNGIPRVSVGEFTSAVDSSSQYGMQALDETGAVIFDTVGLRKVISLVTTEFIGNPGFQPYSSALTIVPGTDFILPLSATRNQNYLIFYAAPFYSSGGSAAFTLIQSQLYGYNGSWVPLGATGSISVHTSTDTGYSDGFVYNMITSNVMDFAYEGGFSQARIELDYNMDYGSGTTVNFPANIQLTILQFGS